jgi:hypothetical protein
MATEIRVADEIQPLESALIAQHHPSLRDCKILWLMSNAKRTREGNIRSGVGKKASPELKFLASALLEPGADPDVELGPDFVITMSSAVWHACTTPEQRLELIDHQLCHLRRIEKANRRTGKVTVTWGRRGHDLEEFTDIVKRYGLQNPRTKRFIQAGAQLALFEPPEPKPDKPKRRRKTTVDKDSTVVVTKVEQPPAAQVVSDAIRDLSEAREAKLNAQLTEDGADIERDLETDEELPGSMASAQELGLVPEVVYDSQGNPWVPEELPDFSGPPTREERIAALDAHAERMAAQEQAERQL